MDIELAKKRLEICKQCPLYRESSRYGATCDNAKYISKDGLSWSRIKKPGYIRGCGCNLIRKAERPNSHCIVGKW